MKTVIWICAILFLSFTAISKPSPVDQKKQAVQIETLKRNNAKKILKYRHLVKCFYYCDKDNKKCFDSCT